MSYNLYTEDVSVVADVIQQCMDRKESSAFFAESDKKYAFVPISWNKNQEWLFLQNGVTPYTMFYDTAEGHGVIIADPNDLSFLVMRPYDETKSICDDFESLLSSYIKSKFPNSEFVGNDILIDGKKAIGTASGILNGMTLFMFAASFVDNSELINLLCPPGHIKVPQPIDTSILTKEEFKNEIISWLQ